MIKFSCNACGQRFSVENSFAGRKVKCPECSAPNRVPSDQSDLPQMAPLDASFWESTAKPLSNWPKPPQLHADVTPSNEPVESRKLPIWAACLLSCTYILLAIGTLVGGFFIIVELSRVENVLQQSAIGALGACYLIGGYILGRCIEKIVRSICRL